MQRRARPSPDLKVVADQFHLWDELWSNGSDYRVVLRRSLRPLPFKLRRKCHKRLVMSAESKGKRMEWFVWHWIGIVGPWDWDSVSCGNGRGLCQSGIPMYSCSSVSSISNRQKGLFCSIACTSWDIY